MYTQRPALKESNLFFFDSETGGFDPVKTDMLEVAAVLTDPSGTKVLEEYSAKVFPKKPVDPQAAAVNGYNAEKWAAEAVDLDHAMQKLLSMARNAVFVAHNAPFDWAFLEAAMRPRFQKWTGSYHKIDTVALAMPLCQAGLVESVKLVTLTRFFNVSHEDAHTALSDARACRSVFLALMGIYGPAIATYAAERKATKEGAL